MMCPACVYEGQRSRVRYLGGAAHAENRDAFPDYYFDEDGRWHEHDATLSVQSFSCTNGHRWQQASRHMCPTCAGEHFDPVVWWRVIGPPAASNDRGEA